MPDAHNPANLAVFVSQTDLDDLDIAYPTIGASVGIVDSTVGDLKNHMALRLGDYHLDVGKSLGINKVRVRIHLEAIDIFGPPYPGNVNETFTYDRDFDSDEFLFVQLSSKMKLISRGLEINGTEKKPSVYTYANTSARLAATGFNDADIWKIAYQENTKTFWELTKVKPPVWRRIYDSRVNETMQAAMWFPLGPILFLDVTRAEDGKYTGGTVTGGSLKLSPSMVGALPTNVLARATQSLIRVNSAFLKTGDGTVPVDQTMMLGNMRYPILCSNGFTGPSHPDPHYASGIFGVTESPVSSNPFAWDLRANFYSEGYVRWPGVALPPEITPSDYWKIGNFTSELNGFLDFRLTAVGDNFLWVQESFQRIPLVGGNQLAHKAREISFTLRDSF